MLGFSTIVGRVAIIVQQLGASDLTDSSDEGATLGLPRNGCPQMGRAAHVPLSQ